MGSYIYTYSYVYVVSYSYTHLFCSYILSRTRGAVHFAATIKTMAITGYMYVANSSYINARVNDIF